MYAALLKLSAYINSDLKHDVYKYYVCDVINLNDDCKHTVNQCCDCYVQKHKHYCNVKDILVET